MTDVWINPLPDISPSIIFATQYISPSVVMCYENKVQINYSAMCFFAFVPCTVKRYLRKEL